LGLSANPFRKAARNARGALRIRAYRETVNPHWCSVPLYETGLLKGQMALGSFQDGRMDESGTAKAPEKARSLPLRRLL
jgi:hypothetical protein